MNPRYKKYMKHAKEILVKNGSLTAGLFVSGRKGDDRTTMIFMFASFEPESKRPLMKAVAHKLKTENPLKEVKVDEVALVTEAWVSVATKNTANSTWLSNVIPSQDPQRKEAIIVMVQRKDGSSELMTQFFAHKGDKIVFEKDFTKEMGEGPVQATSPLLDAFWEEYNDAL